MIALTPIDISKALAIDGWMSEQELVWLAEQAAEHKSIVEIGSYLGRSTRALLDHTQGFVYAVDDWKGPRDVYINKEQRKGIYQSFLDNVSDKNDHLVVIQLDHRLIGNFPQPDMVFIDGSHEYLDVKNDIEIWLPRIEKGGLLCGHDFGVFEGVDRAVVELLGEVEVAENTSIWYKTI